MGLANQITLFRILLVPVFIIFIGYNEPLYALITFFIAGITDALDGFIARKFNQITTLGKILDPIADKTLLISSFFFIYNSDMSVKFPFWYVVLVISRDIYILVGSAIIYFLKGSLEVKPSIFGKATTFFQILSVIVILLANITTIDILIVDGVIYAATAFTILSTLTYFQEGIQRLK
ncbi:CDP-diacylglycerol--glycerol-3-phosphate 3-phosphatidyltransferase [Persephonella sp.]